MALERLGRHANLVELVVGWHFFASLACRQAEYAGISRIFVNEGAENANFYQDSCEPPG